MHVTSIKSILNIKPFFVRGQTCLDINGNLVVHEKQYLIDRFGNHIDEPEEGSNMRCFKTCTCPSYFHTHYTDTTSAEACYGGCAYMTEMKKNI